MCAPFLAVVLAMLPSAVRPEHLPEVPLHAAVFHAPGVPVDVQHVRLDLRFDMAARQAQGTATITVVPLQRADTLALDAGDLRIISIVSNGKPLAFAYNGGHADGGLRIALPKGQRTGDAITMEIAYRTTYVNESDPNNLGGSFGKGLRFFGPTTTEPRKRVQVWSMPELGSNRYWFPSYDGLGDPRTVELILHVPKQLTAVASGELIEDRAETGDFHQVHWRCDTPHDNYQTYVVLGEYVRTEQHAGNTTLCTYGYPDEREATAASVERLPEMMDFFTRLTGVAFHEPTYEQVVVQDFAWGRSCATGIQSENMVDDHGTHADFLYLWDLVEAEALAQQWCGMNIHMRDPGDAWVSRGLARFLSERFSEKRNGRDEFLLWNHLYNQNVYLSDWSAGVRRPVSTTHYDDAATVAQDDYTINRGALVLHQLRAEIGDSAFDAGLKRFMADRWGKDAGTDDLQRAMEGAAGRGLSWFFDQWVRTMGHPVFEADTTFDRTSGMLQLRVKQVQEADTSALYPHTRWFQGHIDIALDGDLRRVWVEAKEENTFRFAMRKPPAIVVIDHQGAWIKELRMRRSSAGWIALYTGTTDVMAQQQALTELVRIHNDSTTSAGDRHAIVQALQGAIRDRSSYWRVRYNAMAQLRSLVPSPLDPATTALLRATITQEGSWNRAVAISTLGTTKDPAYAQRYIDMFQDPSDRVVNAAAIALGRSKSPLAFDALVKLKDRPSWKNQSLISALYGLKELGDPRGADIALAALRDDPPGARWTLATPVWDYRLAAADLLVALRRTKEAWPILEHRFNAAMVENDVNDIFSNVLLMSDLGDERIDGIFPRLRERFKVDANAMIAIEGFAARAAEARTRP